METIKTVELSLAYVFDCEECGRENFVRAVVYEFSPEERQETFEDRGEVPQTGSWVSHPEEVKCAHCGAHFKTKHAEADDSVTG